MATRLRNFVIFGAAGSGKGTIASKIVADFAFHHVLHCLVVHLCNLSCNISMNSQVSSGDLLRKNIHVGSELGKAAKSFMDQGKLVPDSLIVDLIQSEVNKYPSSSAGILLDGFPRTVEQAQALQRFYPVHVVLRLDVPHKVSLSLSLFISFSLSLHPRVLLSILLFLFALDFSFLFLFIFLYIYLSLSLFLSLSLPVSRLPNHLNHPALFQGHYGPYVPALDSFPFRSHLFLRLPSSSQDWIR